eukprot:GILK01005765.1.p1 GENE.GILK01005765.1~~GILK01005765.1.p1  ORF type:complete len:1025 (-),score=160.97 GILK01005765.1:346-3420(-)
MSQSPKASAFLTLTPRATATSLSPAARKLKAHARETREIVLDGHTFLSELLKSSQELHGSPKTANQSPDEDSPVAATAAAAGVVVKSARRPASAFTRASSARVFTDASLRVNSSALETKSEHPLPGHLPRAKSMLTAGSVRPTNLVGAKGVAPILPSNRTLATIARASRPASADVLRRSAASPPMGSNVHAQERKRPSSAVPRGKIHTRDLPLMVARENAVDENDALTVVLPLDAGERQIVEEVSFRSERSPRKATEVLESPIPVPDHMQLLQPVPFYDNLKDMHFSEEERSWKMPFFPAPRPVGRKDAILLQSWLDASLETVPPSDVVRLHQIYTTCFQELNRQVSVQCSERGDIMTQIWNRYVHSILFYQLTSIPTRESCTQVREEDWHFDRQPSWTRLVYRIMDLDHEKRAKIVEQWRAIDEWTDRVADFASDRLDEIAVLRCALFSEIDDAHDAEDIREMVQVRAEMIERGVHEDIIGDVDAEEKLINDIIDRRRTKRREQRRKQLANGPIEQVVFPAEIFDVLLTSKQLVRDVTGQLWEKEQWDKQQRNFLSELEDEIETMMEHVRAMRVKEEPPILYDVKVQTDPIVVPVPDIDPVEEARRQEREFWIRKIHEREATTLLATEFARRNKEALTTTKLRQPSSKKKLKTKISKRSQKTTKAQKVVGRFDRRRKRHNRLADLGIPIPYWGVLGKFTLKYTPKPVSVETVLKQFRQICLLKYLNDLRLAMQNLPPMTLAQAMVEWFLSLQKKKDRKAAEHRLMDFVCALNDTDTLDESQLNMISHVRNFCLVGDQHWSLQTLQVYIHFLIQWSSDFGKLDFAIEDLRLTPVQANAYQTQVLEGFYLRSLSVKDLEIDDLAKLSDPFSKEINALHFLLTILKAVDQTIRANVDPFLQHSFKICPNLLGGLWMNETQLTKLVRENFDRNLDDIWVSRVFEEALVFAFQNPDLTEEVINCDHFIRVCHTNAMTCVVTRKKNEATGKSKSKKTTFTFEPLFTISAFDVLSKFAPTTAKHLAQLPL